LRFLLTCVPGLGHFNPLIPLARALEKSGHVVAVATAPAFADAVTAAGLEFVPAGMDWDERRLLETLPELRSVAKMYRGEWMMNNLFLDRSPRRMTADLLAIIPAWRPDLIIAGSFEYGGPIAAEKSGLPYVNANYTVRWNRWILKHAIGRSIAKVRKHFGLPADLASQTFGRYLDLCFAPPSWTFEGALLRPALTHLVAAKVRSSDVPLNQRLWGLRALLLQRIFARSLRKHPEYTAIGPTTHFIGDDDAPQEHSAPDWLQRMPRQPTVFVSLGTVLSAEYPEIFDKILSGLRDQPINLIMTMGGKDDPSRFGPQPPNVRIVSFIAQDQLQMLLPHVDLCINHAGYGSVMDSLRLGVPLVLLPLVSDAPMNTQMCLSTGVTPNLPAVVWGLSPKGLPVIRPDRLTPAIIHEAATKALHDPAYRNAARRIQNELAARPGFQEAVRLIEQIVEGGSGSSNRHS
jgi:UDP:flavonoid glycosyltransferase YjiC (YdhE family)